MICRFYLSFRKSTNDEDFAWNFVYDSMEMRNFSHFCFRCDRTLNANNFIIFLCLGSILFTSASCTSAELFVDDDSTTLPRPLYNYYYSAKFSPTLFNPCTYPSPTDAQSWQKCNVEHETANKYNICDPESTIYFSTSKRS